MRRHNILTLRFLPIRIRPCIFSMPAINAKETAEIRKNSTPGELADRRKKALKQKGPKVPRDA